MIGAKRSGSEPSSHASAAGPIALSETTETRRSVITYERFCVSVELLANYAFCTSLYHITKAATAAVARKQLVDCTCRAIYSLALEMSLASAAENDDDDDDDDDGDKVRRHVITRSGMQLVPTEI